MTFAEYILKARVGDNPQGDFIADARLDVESLEKIRSQRALLRHLERVNACSGAILAAGKVWAAYQRAKRRKFQ